MRTFIANVAKTSLTACLIVAFATVSTAPALAATSASLPEVQRQEGLPPMCAWLPQTKPRLVILAIHGLGLHMGSYSDMGERLGKDGIATYAMDVRGFGSWYINGDARIDFDNTLADIGNSADYIARRYPGVPIFILGESMGGAIALQAAAKFPDKFTGLVCSVPSGDRFGDVNADMHIGFKVLTRGFKERFDAGSSVIKFATKDEEHRQKWANDPRARKDFSAGELLTFQTFMNKNFAAAKTLQAMPVLFVQGANDKLVRPSGTWDVYDHLLTPNRKIVFSKGAEHLIFENGRFDDQDINYVTSWMRQNEHGAPSPVAIPATRPASEPDEKLAVLQSGVDAASSAPAIIKSAANLTYWIELKRNGQTYRCNNKMQFRSGDEIRFHVRSGMDGYGYIFLAQGSTGGRAMLFPDNRTGTDNQLTAGKDCAIPTRSYLRFDDTPGVEKVSVVFSKSPVDINKILHDPNTITAYVSQDRSGAKDLVPTRMQLSWDDPTPILLAQEQKQALSAQQDSALVRVSYNHSDTIALDIALEHR